MVILPDLIFRGMKKVWPYITAILAGMVLGIIIAVKWLTGQDITVEVKKIKNKKTSGDNTVTVPVNIETRKEKRKRRKANKNK